MRVKIEEYRESWVTDFLELREFLQGCLNNLNVRIEHVGSTSVEGLGAKPIIDILAGVENETDLDKTIQPMQQAGLTYIKKYERASEHWTAMPERRLYCKSNPMNNQPTPEIIDFDDKLGPDFVLQSNIHTVVKNTYFWKRTIAFRDYLKAHRFIRDEYYLIKKEISKQEFEDMLRYNEAKNDFIKDVEKKALIWYENLHKK